MPDLQSVGVAIVNRNAGNDILDCVASLRAEGIEDIVVVDNGSKDGSDLRLIEADPGVRLFRLNDKGYGSGMNRAVSELRNDVVFVLNPDTQVHPGAIKQMLEALNSDPQIACVGPKVLNDDGTQYPSARRFPKLTNSIGHGLLSLVLPNNRWSNKYKRLDGDYSSQQIVDWVSGSAMFHRREAFLSVGGFDPRYYLYMEDVDLCWRLNKEGWKIMFEPAAEITHIGGTSTRQTPYKTLKVHHQSAIRYTARTTTGPARLLVPFFAAGLMARLGVASAQRFVRRTDKKVQQQVKS